MNETLNISRGFHPTGDNPRHQIHILDMNYFGNWLFGDVVHHDNGYVSYVGQNPADGTMVVKQLLPATVGVSTGKFDTTQWDELTTDEQAHFLYPLEVGCSHVVL